MRRFIGFACVMTLGIFVAVGASRWSLAEEGCKAEAKTSAKTEGTGSGKAEADKTAMVSTYKCEKTGKTWTQPSTEKKACPSCGAAAPECGTLVKTEPAAKTVYSCKYHKFIAEKKPGRCKVCNLPLVETQASAVSAKKVRRNAKGELIDVSKEPEACEQNQE